MPLICPTCQNFSRDRSGHRPICYFAWGCFRYFGWSGLPSRSSRAAPAFAQVGYGAAAFTRFASEGGPGRTRTCNQTVMSGRTLRFCSISIAFVAFQPGCFWCEAGAVLGCGPWRVGNAFRDRMRSEKHLLKSRLSACDPKHRNRRSHAFCTSRKTKMVYGRRAQTVPPAAAEEQVTSHSGISRR